MASIEQREGPDGIEMVLGGELTIANVALLRNRLQEALSAGRPVRVVLKAVADIDVAVLQLLCSAHRTGARRNVPFTLESGGEPRVEDVVRRAGFVRQVGCGEGGRQACLWTAGGGQA